MILRFYSLCILFSVFALNGASQEVKLRITINQKGAPVRAPFWKFSSFKYIHGHSLYDLADSLKDGQYALYSDSTFRKVLVRGKYVKSKKEGQWKYYYTSGQLQLLVNYKAGKAEGKLVQLSRAGDTLVTGNYIQSRLNGVLCFYNNMNGITRNLVYSEIPCVLQETIEFRNDTILKSETYYPNGKIQMVNLYEKGKIFSGKRYTVYGDLAREIKYSPGYKEIIYDGKTAASTYNLSLYGTKKNPPIDSIRSMKNLESISIQFEDYNSNLSKSYLDSIFASLVQLPRLVSVHLSAKINELPAGLFQLKSVTGLSLCGRFNVPKEIAMLSNLHSFEIRNYPGDSLVHSISPEISKLKKLRFLSLSGFKIKNPAIDLSFLPLLTGLRGLNMNYEVFCRLPVSICNLTKLLYLNIEYGLCETDSKKAISLPDCLPQLSNLRILRLPECYFWVEKFKNFRETYQSKIPKTEIDFHYSCFPAGTKIQLANGVEKAIEQIEPGDWLFTQHPYSLLPDTTVVTRLNHHLQTENQLVVINTADDSIRLTITHPVFVANKGWTNAGEIVVGDFLIQLTETESGIAFKETQVKSVSLQPVSVLDLYNFSTSKGTYLASGFLVHNK